MKIFSNPIRWVLVTALVLIAPMVAMAAPPPGHPNTDEAAKILNLPESGQHLPYAGRVEEAFDSNNYTYIKVNTEKGPLWLAAPRVELMPGADIRFGQGTLMRNWYSKVHKRSFEQILFVPEVVVVTPSI